MDIVEHTRLLRESRMKVWNEAQGFLDRIQGREMSAEENVQWKRYNDHIDELDAQVRSFVETEERERQSAVAREGMERQFGAHGVAQREAAENDMLRHWILNDSKRGGELTVDIRSARREAELIRQGASPAEVRALAWDTGSIASGVPTTMARTLYGYLEASCAMMRMPTYKFETTSGEQMKFPRLNAHGIATQVSGQGTTLAGTDPTFLSMTLDSYKYAELCIVASEVVQDAAFDISMFLGMDMGRAVGRKIGTDLVTGSGSGKPNGVMNALASAGSVATGGSLITPTYENLVDTIYAVNDEYRASGAAAWLARDATFGIVRKLRDGAGGTLGAAMWQPSMTSGLIGGQPDRLMGYPVYPDPNVASCASNARIMAFGDFSAYYVRTVGQISIERDDSRYFDTDQIGFRSKWRVDGDLIDTTAIVSLLQNVT